MCGPVLLRRWSSYERLSSNNEIAGFKFATVGVIYSVLVAFAVIVVWEKFNDADLIGLPLRVTVGKKTLEDGMVDVRQRAGGAEKRVVIADIGKEL